MVISNEVLISEFTRTVRYPVGKRVGEYREVTYFIKKMRALLMSSRGVKSCYVYLRKPINESIDWKIYDITLWNDTMQIWESFGANMLSSDIQSTLLATARSDHSLSAISGTI